MSWTVPSAVCLAAKFAGSTAVAAVTFGVGVAVRPPPPVVGVTVPLAAVAPLPSVVADPDEEDVVDGAIVDGTGKTDTTVDDV